MSRTGAWRLTVVRSLPGVAASLAALGWGVMAIHYAGPPSAARDAVALGFLVASAGLLVAGIRQRRAWVGFVVLFAAVLAWWLSLPPRNDRHWEPDVATLAWVEVQGDTVVVHNVRNFEYRTERDYVARYEDRAYSLARLRTADFFLSYWGLPWVAHTVVSFGFEDGRFLAVSIETRREKGETYSALAGFFRHYELIYVVADERDVIRLRTNYRREDVYLYRLRTPVEAVRAEFLDYVRRINRLRHHPEWYNALTDNCTTAIPSESRVRSWRSWKVLANGYLDELAYEIGAIDRQQPFPELRTRSRINGRARDADRAPDFSRRIREGLPGMTGL